MAKGKSKGKGGGGGGTATIIGTNNPNTISFINKQVKDLGITGSVNIEFREGKEFVGGFVSFDTKNNAVKDGDTYYWNPIQKVTIINGKFRGDGSSIIAHELTHIKQMQDGRLKQGYKERKEDYFGQTRVIRYDAGIYWDNKLYITFTDYVKILGALKKAKTQKAYNKALTKYKALPWEKEAHEAGDKYE